MMYESLDEETYDKEGIQALIRYYKWFIHKYCGKLLTLSMIKWNKERNIYEEINFSRWQLDFI
jgi:hypothetical protein